ncbi:TauD/TfdA family dioxygenase [Streptomyces spectabilis]|uniref:Taurine dioxygenase n=2 Tax=Streptomyces spectabilis TaxID=68270 RepID=A0A516RHK8_STRST|nr:TauD/TfdA family dioxygenase [Streptomyces spectabilis]MBB5105567.1 taurine dioxygenase [Streptomyces spectabilis]MCI3906753.1 TauD/TfdA family dioxygenase [Streptomyces spectabilis]QDQ15124.1 taurine dioxygenase [Streptomyces spectabilis]QEV63561.1 taurine dioxygenase [Streptomyces spectabilis]GGV22434.1 taurine dioxygenase [Streptomyces spectabilis]
MEQFALDAIEAITTRPPEVYDHITVDALTPVIGAEVSGLDLSKELTDEQAAEVKRAFLRHHVLVFRDQVIDGEQHKRFARHFGELHPVALAPEGSDPHILEISADKDSRNVAGHGWHADGTADLKPSLGSMLYVTRTPEIGSGGDTMFSNMHLAYEMLSPAMKELLDPMTAVHNGLLAWEGATPPPEYDVPVNVHPVVARHPDTGRKLLFINGIYVSHIEQLSKGESRAIIDMLVKQITNTALLSCRVRWTPNTLVFWDNRCVQHHAIWDYFPHSRYAQRVAIAGHRPTA